MVIDEVEVTVVEEFEEVVNELLVVVLLVEVLFVVELLVVEVVLEVDEVVLAELVEVVDVADKAHENVVVLKTTGPKAPQVAFTV